MTRWWLVVVVLGLSACGGGNKSPTAPTPPPVPTCQSQNTALVQFRNRSTANLTYDIIWDGSRLVTVGPGQDSQKYTYAANVTHTLRFQFTNTNVLACNASAPVLTTCSDVFYSCGS
jgi:hypothetical protein